MRFEHGGCTYELVCITDVSSNGYGLEMSEIGPQGGEVLVMTAFRPFGTLSVRVSMHAERLDFEVVKVFLDTVKVNLVDRIEPPDLEGEG
jgi:hypothetical protein